MKWQAIVAVLLVSMIVASESFLFPEIDSRTTKAMKKFRLRQYQKAMNKLVAREAADKATASDESGEVEEDEDEDEEEESVSGQEEKTASGVRSWNARRQFNSAMGIGIDAPMTQPQTNAYDVYNTQQQGGAPWESNSDDEYDPDEYYYYYYIEEDVPLPRRKSRRQPLKPEAGRMMKRARRPYHVRRASRHDNKQTATRDRPAEMDFRLGRLHSIAKWKKNQN